MNYAENWILGADGESDCRPIQAAAIDARCLSDERAQQALAQDVSCGATSAEEAERFLYLRQSILGKVALQ